MTGKIYGYVRVSSKDQNEHRQVKAMKDFSIPTSQILVLFQTFSLVHFKKVL